jgi:hypothetical protein
MKAVAGVRVGARWMAGQLEVLLFVLAVALVAGGTFLACAPTVSYWN